MADRQYHDEEWLRERYWGDMMSTGEIADVCDVDRSTIVRWLDRLDIETRDVSDYDQKEITKKAREAAFEKYGEGGPLQHQWEENTDEMLEHAAENAALGAPARETNGMEGVTGEDNPNWRGGKDLYDAVVIALPGPAWWTLRNRHRGDECEMCGATDVELHLHHIVPVLAGGTNEPWNLLTLCEECHTAAEWRTREFADPVLVE